MNQCTRPVKLLIQAETALIVSVTTDELADNLTVFAADPCALGLTDPRHAQGNAAPAQA